MIHIYYPRHLQILFCDWEFGIDLRSWYRAVSKKEMNERLGAFMRINSSTSTIGYQWCFMSNISDLLEVNLHHGFERNHNFVSVAVNKHSKSSRPFYYQTTLVPTSFFIHFVGSCFGNDEHEDDQISHPRR